MSIVANRHRNQLSSQYPRTKTPDSPSRSSPRPNTPSRNQSRSFEPQPRGDKMESPTPTPRKRAPRRRGARRADQRDQEAQEESEPGPNSAGEADDDEELMQLLGLEPPAHESATDISASTAAANLVEATNRNSGILPISKEDIKAAAPRGRRGNKNAGVYEQGQENGSIAPRSAKKQGNKQKGHPVDMGFAPEGADASQDTKPKNKNNRRTPHVPRTTNDDSAVAASFDNVGGPATTTGDGLSKVQSVAPHPSVMAINRDLVSFDMSALSKSLPSANVGHIRSVSERAPSTTAGKEELTWQQKLQQTSTPVNNKPTRQSSDRKPRKAAPSAFTGQSSSSSSSKPSRPAHARRASTDGFSLPVPPKSAPPQQAYAFDQPYSTGFNANRAPQTPSKDAVKPIPINTPLPVIPGEFPRIGKNKIFDNVLGPRSSAGATTSATASAPAPRYAGPTSHNSPHAASLAKPGLEDF